MNLQEAEQKTILFSRGKNPHPDTPEESMYMPVELHHFGERRTGPWEHTLSAKKRIKEGMLRAWIRRNREAGIKARKFL